jgi:RapZ-like N-terminal domain
MTPRRRATDAHAPRDDADVRASRHNQAMSVTGPPRPHRAANERGSAEPTNQRSTDRRPASQPAEPAVSSRLRELVVITGFSGAGKSTAMNVFEDAGYFCVDNLPPEMIRSLVDLFLHEGSNVQRAAVVSYIRGGAYF